MPEITHKMIDDVGRALIERGLIVAAGYEGYKLMCPHAMRSHPVYAEAEQRAFFAGAQHLFASIMNQGLDEGTEPTDADLRRMDNIANELKVFERELEKRSTH